MQPKFMEARAVPLAMKEAVEMEIDQLEQDSILKPISYSDLTSPIVIVLKPDGKVRICWDYK